MQISGKIIRISIPDCQSGIETLNCFTESVICCRMWKGLIIKLSRKNTLNLNKIQILIEFMYLSSCEIVPMATLEKYHFFAVYNLTDDTEENNSKFNVFQELY